MLGVLHLQLPQTLPKASSTQAAPSSPWCAWPRATTGDTGEDGALGSLPRKGLACKLGGTGAGDSRTLSPALCVEVSWVQREELPHGVALLVWQGHWRTLGAGLDSAAGSLPSGPVLRPCRDAGPCALAQGCWGEALVAVCCEPGLAPPLGVGPVSHMGGPLARRTGLSGVRWGPACEVGRRGVSGQPEPPAWPGIGLRGPHVHVTWRTQDTGAVGPGGGQAACGPGGPAHSPAS